LPKPRKKYFELFVLLAYVLLCGFVGAVLDFNENTTDQTYLKSFLHEDPWAGLKPLLPFATPIPDSSSTMHWRFDVNVPVGYFTVSVIPQHRERCVTTVHEGQPECHSIDDDGNPTNGSPLPH
jgi:hypothetical protein